MEDKSNELIRKSMLRARTAEEICRRKSLSGDVSGFSLIGLFSLLDAIMDTSFEKILTHINLPEKITTALIHPDDSKYGAVIKVIRAYDEADWDEAQKAGSLIGLSLEEYQKIYLKSIEWCDDIYNNLFHS